MHHAICIMHHELLLIPFPMEFFDVILFIILGGFAIFGIWFGFFHTLGSLFGTVFGVYLASRFYDPMSLWLIEITGWDINVARVIMFTLTFVFINRLIGFVFWIVDRFLDVLTHLPFISGLNRMFGFALGLFEGLITIGFFVYFVEIFPVSDWLMDQIEGSFIAPIALNTVEMMLPLLPEAIRAIGEQVEFLEEQWL